METKKIVTIISSIFLTVIINSSIIAQTCLDSLIRTLPETCTTLMNQRGWPSLSISIVHDQEILFSQAFGYANIDNQIPATTKTIYRVGSITKLFTTTMLMQLEKKKS